MALKNRGVEPRFQDYYRAWVLGFLGVIKPKKFEVATADDVREFLEKLSGESKKEWQLRQAEEGVRVFFQEVEPQRWAGNWPTDLLANVKLGIDEQGPADIGRQPTQGAATLAYAGREDTGDLEGRYVPFLEQTTEALRLERYSYRTEQSYLEWVRRFLIFAQPASRADLRWWQVKEYLEYLTLKRRVASSTLNQALSALQFLFSKVLRRRAGNADVVSGNPAGSRVGAKGCGGLP